MVPAPAPIEPLAERVGTSVSLQAVPAPATAPKAAPTQPVAAPTAAPAAAAAPPPAPSARLADAADAAVSKANAAAAVPPSQPTPVPELPLEAAGRKDLAETVAITARRVGAVGQTELVIRPPDNGLTRWRITAPGVVQRTTDNGATWEAQRTGEVGLVTAGTAPSATVCWLVGRRGLVLLSTDGRTWRRVTFPQPLDVVAVSASDDKTATVTTVDGRTFTTTDSGKSWK